MPRCARSARPCAPWPRYPLPTLTAARCSFYSSRVVTFEVEKGPEQKSSRRYASMTCRTST